MVTVGIIGFGMVGKAVHNALLDHVEVLIVDPLYHDRTIEQMVRRNPMIIFVCVPTPSDGTDFKILRDTLDELKSCNFEGIVVVKSTALPGTLDNYDDVVYNPEFLSRATSYHDFLYPDVMVVGGKGYGICQVLMDFYDTHTNVVAKEVVYTDVKTAALIKYATNTFYALKVTFMNEIYDVAQKVGADYDLLIAALAANPRMGNYHFMVPGPDGERGFGGPCLPKDTKALAEAFDVELLKTVLKLNERHNRTIE